jgi:hypothetical protein
MLQTLCSFAALAKCCTVERSSTAPQGPFRRRVRGTVRENMKKPKKVSGERQTEVGGLPIIAEMLTLESERCKLSRIPAIQLVIATVRRSARRFFLCKACMRLDYSVSIYLY